MRTDTPIQIKLADYQPYPFAIDTVRLQFVLKPEATQVRARLQVRRQAAGDMVLDGIGLALKALKIDGVDVANDMYRVTPETLTLLSVPDVFELETEVEINPAENTELSGLYISGGRFCTQCEAVGFRRITYWPDRPDVMSKFHVRLEADARAYPILLSNGTLGSTGALPGDTHFAEWDDPHPKPSYLFALCAGDYDMHHDSFRTASGKDIDLTIHADRGDGERAVWAMESLKAAMRWDEQVFGREYDLGAFNIVAVRDFNFGAMENKGLNIFNSAYVLADEKTATDADFEAIESIVGHEYFHNWTGNRITCRDWFQLCLKEGLTVFRDQEFSADMRSRSVQRIKDVIRLRARQFAEDAGPLAHPVRPDSYGSIDNLYTATVYEKGAELIRMLKTLIGADNFAQGMQLYFDRHDGDATTIEHFYACFEEASGQDLSAFRRWYAQPGTPHITVTDDWSETTTTLQVTFTQSNPVTPHCAAPQPLPMPIKIAVFSPSGEKYAEQTLRLEGETLNWTLENCPQRPLLSINRGFSAPIKLEHAISDHDRLALAKIDDDPFNQWQALQSLYVRELIGLAYTAQDEVDPDVIAAATATIRRSDSDPAFAALLLRLPDIGELMIEQTPADPARLDAARKQVQSALYQALASDITATLNQASPTPFKPNAEQAGIRALRSAYMTLLASAGAAGHAELKTAFDSAKNMTERLASLRALCAADTPDKPAALAQFYADWSHNPLVMDKWFAVQAANTDADGVADLLKHADFDYRNPNRVRATIGVFAMQNFAQFHTADGTGYLQLAQVIETVDPLNPALAARLLTAFEQWRSLSPDLQAKAQATLTALTTKDLSKNAQDILQRTLGS